MSEYDETVLQNQPVDVSEEFARQQNHFFIASKASAFDPDAATGTIRWRGCSLKQRVSYHQLTLQFEDYRVWEDLPPVAPEKLAPRVNRDGPWQLSRIDTSIY